MSATLSPPLPVVVEAIRAALPQARLSWMLSWASLTLFTYDHVLTTGMEVSLIWPSKWTLIKVIWLLQRYMPFFDTGFLMFYENFALSGDLPGCHASFAVSGWLITIGITLSEFILAARVWAVWRCGKKIGVFLGLFITVLLGLSITVLVFFGRSLKAFSLPYPGLQCFVQGDNSVIALCWVIFTVWDIGMLILLVIPAISAYKWGGSSSLVSTVYRDGIFHYLCICGLSIANLAVMFLVPEADINLLSVLERLLHSTLTSRVVLHLRAQAEETLIDIPTLGGMSLVTTH